MDPLLVAIKRLCHAGRDIFTARAEAELIRDGLRREDVIESILNADRIKRRLRSTNRMRRKRDHLYVIESKNWDGLRIYTNGRIATQPDGGQFYVMISSKWGVR